MFVLARLVAPGGEKILNNETSRLPSTDISRGTGRVVQFSVCSSGDEGVDASVAPRRSASGMGRGVSLVTDTESYAVDPFVASKFGSIIGDVHCRGFVKIVRVEIKRSSGFVGFFLGSGEAIFVVTEFEELIKRMEATLDEASRSRKRVYNPQIDCGVIWLLGIPFSSFPSVGPVAGQIRLSTA